MVRSSEETEFLNLFSHTQYEWWSSDEIHCFFTISASPVSQQLEESYIFHYRNYYIFAWFLLFGWQAYNSSRNNS